jgi:tubulin--tyrosine ligase
MYPRILALFSAAPYSPPIAEEIPESGGHISIDLTPHLTNTSLQRHRGEEGVRLLDELIGCPILSHPGSSQNAIDSQLTLTAGDIAELKDQMADVLSETFKAALENPVHFQVRSSLDASFPQF